MKTEGRISAKERILESAQRLFAEQGFWGTSVQDITEAAGVNKAMLFYYFESKENLYFRLIEGILGEVLETVKDKISARRNPVEKLAVILETYDELCSIPKNFEVFKIVFQDIMGPDRARESLAGNVRDIIDLIAAVIEEGIATGVFRKVDSRLTALSILGICYIFARHRLIFDHEFKEGDASRHIQSIILEGILS